MPQYNHPIKMNSGKKLLTTLTVYQCILSCQEIPMNLIVIYNKIGGLQLTLWKFLIEKIIFMKDLINGWLVLNG